MKTRSSSFFGPSSPQAEILEGDATGFRVDLTGRRESAPNPLTSVLTSTFAANAAETGELPLVPTVTAKTVVVPRGCSFAPSPILLEISSLARCLSFWKAELFNVDSDDSFLWNGIANGFKIVSDISVIQPAACFNYPSALESTAKPLLDKLFREEIEQGKLLPVDFRPLRVHAIGAVSKKESETPRSISDCSRPFSCSLNSSIQYDHFHFDSIDDVVKLSYPNCFYSVVDIQSAYRYVPVHPEHWTLQGLCWEFESGSPQYLVDRFLCFGLANGPENFNRISKSVARMMRRRGFVIVPYLDDFLLIAQSEESCRFSQQTLNKLLVSLGFAVKWSENLGPSSRIQFFGIIVDSQMECLELPLDKLARSTDLADRYSKEQKLTRKELEVIVGHMSFAGKAIYGARTFSRGFIDAMHQLTRPFHH